RPSWVRPLAPSPVARSSTSTVDDRYTASIAWRPRATPARPATAEVRLTTTSVTPMKKASTAVTRTTVDSTDTLRLHSDDAGQPEDAEHEQGPAGDQQAQPGRVGHQRCHVVGPEHEHEQAQGQRQRDEDPGRHPPLGRQRPDMTA